MKILEICNFSAGISGVWTRVFEESKELAKHHEVCVFSSNAEGESSIAKSEEVIEKIKIKRFPVKKRIGYAVFFDFEEQALKFKPDVIIAHGFRKPYLHKVIKIAKKINAKCFLVTHAPFVEDKIRGKKLSSIIKVYDFIFAKKILNAFDKILCITHWEIPSLLKLGAKKSKIRYLPNGLPREFFEIKEHKPKKDTILFFGRVSDLKDLKTLVKALVQTKNKSLKLDIVGPEEGDCKSRLKNLINKLNLQARVKMSRPIYDLKKKIKLIDSHEFFVLPSKREGLPLSLLEALSRKKIVISSDTQGGKEIIKNGKNGFLFKVGHINELKDILDKLASLSPSKKKSLRAQARKTAGEYRSEKLGLKLEKLFL